MKKKNAILTFHSAPNYGAFLQAYALQCAVTEIDPNVEIIDYQPDFLRKNYSPYRIKGNLMKSLLRILLFSMRDRKKIKVFQSNISNYLKLSHESIRDEADLELVVNRYKNIICGSDQIWNTETTDQNYNYFLPFDLEETTKNSYAASFGNLDFENDPKIMAYTDDFEHLSLRESNSAMKLEICSNNYVRSHVDPTLLLTAKQWNSFANKDRFVSERYVLIYTVKQPKDLIDKAIAFAEEKGLKIIQLANRKKDSRIDYVMNPSPSEFLSYFRDADYIFTNSFHGSVFSLLFEKPYAIELLAADGCLNSRCQSLFADLGISLDFDRDVLEMDRDIDWREIHEEILKGRMRGLAYLSRITAK